jgi:hypothetical protein
MSTRKVYKKNKNHVMKRENSVYLHLFGIHSTVNESRKLGNLLT